MFNFTINLMDSTIVDSFITIDEANAFANEMHDKGVTTYIDEI